MNESLWWFESEDWIWYAASYNLVVTISHHVQC